MSAITKFLIGFSVFGVWALGSRYYYICQIKGMCTEKTIISSDDVRAKTLALRTDKAKILDGYEQFYFPDSSAQLELSEDNKAFLTATADYLKKNPTQKLRITGQYLSSEKNANAGIFENIGLARADAIRTLMAKDYGISKEQIDLDVTMKESGKLVAPLDFFVPGAVVVDKPAAKDDKDKEPKLAEAKFEFANMTYSDANFEYNSDVFKPGKGFVAYADSVKSYLTTNPGKSLMIIGHTDNKGDDKYNQDLGMRRANACRAYFQKIGVKTKIGVESKGEKEPVAPNELPNGADNEQGRAKNRRVNVQIR